MSHDNGWDKSYQLQIWSDEQNQEVIRQQVEDIGIALLSWAQAVNGEAHYFKKLHKYFMTIESELRLATFTILDRYQVFEMDICRLPRYVTVNRILFQLISKKHQKLLPFLVMTEMPFDGFVSVQYNIHKSKR
jgi:hypothetical protein